MLIELGRPLAQGSGRVSQWFGERPEVYRRYGLAGHNGVDYAVRAGAAVLAAHAGVVEVRPFDAAGYGLYVIVRTVKFETLYAHLAQVAVASGQRVTAGQPLGASGSSGNSTGPHLHFGLRVYGMLNPAYLGSIDPVPFREG